MKGSAASAPESRRLDQWLWFARFVKSRSLATRLCIAGAVSINGLVARKANRAVRVGDTVAARQGALSRTVRVLALGARRGPAPEAHLLYEEIAISNHGSELTADWEALLADDEDFATSAK